MLYNSFVYEMSCLYFVSVPRDCPTGHKIPQNPAIFESRVPGLGLNIRGTAGTGTDICGTVPRSLCPGTLVPGLKTRGIHGTVPCPSLVYTLERAKIYPSQIRNASKTRYNFWKHQNFIQNESNSHLVTYESAGFGGFYIKNRFFFQEDFLDINNFDWATFQKLHSKHGFKYVFFALLPNWNIY